MVVVDQAVCQGCCLFRVDSVESGEAVGDAFQDVGQFFGRGRGQAGVPAEVCVAQPQHFCGQPQEGAVGIVVPRRSSF
ncbi:hypothetical protein FM21_15970 [Streptomyces mutabilis]|uniref:Uncharacterized protein n=1 Tax=Streptomyces mutabilis TaxID=67332 RepID=A0A086N8I7_9ACTN|nr:hypothetical protein FM21_15970 [Streptomyces mutabilis]